MNQKTVWAVCGHRYGTVEFQHVELKTAWHYSKKPRTHRLSAKTMCWVKVSALRDCVYIC